MRILTLFIAIWLIAFPAWAMQTPELASALTSAGVGSGNLITDGNGQPVLGANGQPVRVDSVQTLETGFTASTLSNAMKVPLADLFSYASSLGIEMPMMMSGTLTTVTRSDGGTEQVYVFQAADGSQALFMADRTGSNVYGIRIAHVEPSGRARVTTAHGLNGNFTNPPWYLSARAREDYWIRTDIAQLWDPPVISPVARMAVRPSADQGSGMAVFVGDRTNGAASLDRSKMRELMGADRVQASRRRR